jgi:hypothetical protein
LTIGTAVATVPAVVRAEVVTDRADDTVATTLDLP